jgi:flagellar M-ring protein FliF
VSGLLEGLKALGPARLAAMALVAVTLFGLLVVLANHAPTAQMALLYAELDGREAAQMVDALDRQQIPYQLGANGTQILVPADKVSQARISLARDGLPSGGSIGYELLDRADSLTATQAQQRMAEQRALEGEIARTIRTISGIKAARVHLVLPRREPFSLEQQDAQASVMVSTARSVRIDQETVAAIINLTAGAVRGLRAKNVSVVDSNGAVLARAGVAAQGTSGATSPDDIKRAAEARLSRAVEEMLERSLGAGRVRVEASVAMDFERVQETQEKYDPDGQVVRSTQTTSDTSKTSEATPTTSVQNNLPNADAGSAATGSQNAKQEETTNYEIGKTVRTVLRDQPQIRKISLAVMVDGIDEKGADGMMKWQERPATDLAKIAKLVQSAIGYDAARGDRVEVVTMRFSNPIDVTAEAPAGLFGTPLDKSDLMRLGQTGLLVAAAFIALLMVVRPTVNRLIALGTPEANARIGDAVPGQLLAAGLDSSLAGGDAAMGLLGGPDGGDPDAMVTLAKVDGQLRVSSLRRMTELVEQHPDQTLSIIRSWIQQETN